MPSIGSSLLILAITALCFHLAEFSYPDFLNSFGVVVPGDPVVFVGEPLILHCNITSTSIRENSSRLYFEKTTEKGTTRIPNRFTRMLTTKSIRLDIPRLELGDEGNYVCIQTKLDETPRIIGHQYVTVDNSPRSVEDIKCRVFNWEDMTCTWTLGVRYKHPNNINITLVWTIDGKQENCPMISNTSCVWPKEFYTHNHVYIMLILVRAVDGKGKVLREAKSKQFKIETRLIVEPATIQDFQAIEENSTCISLSWTHPSSAKREKFFVGEYKKQGSRKWYPILLDFWAMSDMRDLICNLTPFTNYNFRMSVLPFPEHSATSNSQSFRSKWIYVSGTTWDDVPGSSPPLCHSCYHVQRCHHLKTDTGCRLVRIYWRELPLSERHGDITQYDIRLRTKLGSISENIVKGKITNDRFQISDERYEAELTAGTKKGFSLEPSILTVPSYVERPYPPKRFLVETDVRRLAPFKYYLSWSSLLSSRFNYTGIKVLWCHGSILDYVCKNDINWVNLPPDVVEYELIPGDKVEFHGHIIIGVASEVMEGATVISSGIQWSSCIYERNQKPKSEPQNVRMSHTPDGGLTVSWDRSDCSMEKVYVTQYHVSICRTLDEKMCHEPMINKTVERKTEVTFSSDILTKKKYLVKLWAASSAGNGPSRRMVVSTREKKIAEDVDSSYIIAFIVVSLVLLFFSALTIYGCCRYCRNRKKKIPFPEPIQPYAETKRPLHQSSRFQDRPLPEPPNAEQLYYGLNACMMNHGSRSHSSRSSSDNSVMSNQGQQPLLGRQQSEGGSQSRYMLLSKEDDSSCSGRDSVGTNSKPPSVQRQDSQLSNPSAYSLGNQCSDLPDYNRMTQVGEIGDDTSHDSATTGFIPHHNGMSPIMYETPVCPPELVDMDRPQWLFHRQNTLPLRTFPAKVLIDVGNANNCQIHGTHLPSPKKLCSPKLIPPSSPPPLPAREPMFDVPPQFPAPPPPKMKKQKQKQIPSRNDDYIPNENCDRMNDSSQGHSHSTQEPASSLLPSADDLQTDMKDFTKRKWPHTKNFHFPPPPSSPPSPDPSKQLVPNIASLELTTQTLQTPSSDTPFVSESSDSCDTHPYVTDTFEPGSHIHRPPPIHTLPTNIHESNPPPTSNPHSPSDTPPILNLQSSPPTQTGNETFDSLPSPPSPAPEANNFPLMQEDDVTLDSVSGETPSYRDDDGTSYIHCVEATFKNPVSSSQVPYHDKQKPENGRLTFLNVQSMQARPLSGDLLNLPSDFYREPTVDDSSHMTEL